VSELVSDRAGRQRQRTAGTPPLASHTDAAEQESHRFAERLADLLRKGYDERRYAALLLVAPPRFLGYLRGVMRDPVTRQIVASLDKDYTRLDERELRRLLQPHVAPR
jgi:protein required for attachment to host cells